MRGYRSPGLKLESRRSGGVLSVQPRSRRETFFLLGIVAIAGFFIWRLCQFGSSVPPSNTFTAVLSTTQVMPRAAGGRDGEQPAKVITELVIGRDQGDQRFKQHRKTSLPAETGRSNQRGTSLAALVGLQTEAASKTESHPPPLLELPGVLAGGASSVSQQGSARLGKSEVSTSSSSSSSTETVTGGVRVPVDFDWQTYLLYHPELRDEENIQTEEQAKQHYLAKGRAEGRIYKRLRVLLRYTACTGLINQHYSHIAAFALGAVLGAELVLPPAVKRDSFAHYFSTFKEQNEVKWSADPLDALLDVDKIIEFWRVRGLVIHKTPSLTPFPDLTQPETAFPLYQQKDVDNECVTRLEGLYLQNLDMPELIEKARVAVINKASAALRANPDRDLDHVVLDLPCTFFMLRSLSNLRVVTEVAKSLYFSPKLHAMADRIIKGMAAAGGKDEYNAVHLRIEKDARDWSTIMGGEAVVWHNYIMAMQKAGFSPNVGCYAASGLLTYGADEDMMQIIRTLKGKGLCESVWYKELFLPKDELEALNSEQKALLDFLVLSNGKNFVGFGSSTFSFFLREYRALHSVPRSTSVLVDASVIGTDSLFNSAGTVI